MKIRLLNVQHPEYDGHRLHRYRALYEGGQTWTELLSEWLPKRPQERTPHWEARKRQATYTNDVAGLLDLITGYLFSSPLSGSEWPSEWWSGWLDDVDRRGTGFSRFVSDRLTDALVHGSSYVWVNLPRRAQQPTSRADEEAQGLLDAYLVSYTAEQAIRWGEDDQGNLTWIVFKDAREENTFGSEVRTYNRWTYIDSTSIKVFEAPQDADPEQDATVVLDIQHGVGRLPVVRLLLPASHHAMRVLHDPAVALLRSRNALTWTLERSAYSMLAIYAHGDLSELEGGSGYFLKLPETAKAEWLEPGGAATSALSADIQSKRDDLYRAVRALFQSAHSDALQQQSGVSKAQDWQAFEVVLAEYAELVTEFAEELVDVVGTARREDTSTVELTALEGWQAEDPTTWLSDATVAEPLLKKSPTARKAVAKKAVALLLGDLDPQDREAIEGEIEGADFSDEIEFGLALRGGTGGV